MSDRKYLPEVHNRRQEIKYRSTTCLNCHHPLDRSDRYCPNCSQLNSTKKLAFNDFFNEFFAGIFAYDSRIYRTLGVLLFQPGKISKDYVEGKRVRYANPYRFYLSASIIFFIFWGFTHDVEPVVEAETENTLAQRATTDSILAAEGIKNPALDAILPDPAIMESSRANNKNYLPESALDSLGFTAKLTEKFNIFSEFYENTKIRSSEVALDSLHYQKNVFNEWYYKKMVDTKRFESEQGLFWHFFYGKLPFFIFFYLPVFALFLWLLYLRRPFSYMEHLIFTFHNQTTWFVLFGFSLHLDLLVDSNFFTVIASLLFSFYLYKAFRKFYKQGRVKTLLKFIIINIIFFTLALLAIILSILASFAIY